jgi:O-acetyl-ADP-ribose deacetylase (regulator of RNase III)
MKLKIGNSEIEVVKGDITEADTLAIVNAANNHLWMGAGVAGAIKQKGGVEIEREAVAKGPIEVGEAVLTGAGRLKARYVIHAAGMGQDLKTDAQKIKEATRSSLKLAEAHKIPSVAFPAIGTGVGGFPVHRCAELMIGEAATFLERSRYLQKIVFMLFDETSFGAFRSVLESRTSETHRSPHPR